MQDKLTLRLEEKLIKGAREYAKSQQKSLSQIVSEFFSVLSSRKVSKKGEPCTVHDNMTLCADGLFC